MTLASDVIQSAFRETNLIPVGQTPTSNQSTEALTLLNTLLLSTVGNEVGDGFSDINIGGNYDQSGYTNNYIPRGARLVFNLTSGLTLNLDPHPYDGQRLAFVDAGNNLGTYNVALSGNGRRIEGASSLTLSTNGDSRHWLYRADVGNWMKITTLLLTDVMPFPPEFDDYFIKMLAVLINPRYSQQITAETKQMLDRARGAIRDRYHNYKEIPPDLPASGWVGNPQFPYGSYSDSSAFNKGKPYPFL